MGGVWLDEPAPGPCWTTLIMITLDRLKELLIYDPETGIFRWKKARRGCLANSIAGSATDQDYWHLMLDGKNYKAHRLAWLYMTGEWPVADTDHIDGCRSNNKFKNLRQASRAQNNVNSIATWAASGFRGVYFQKNTKKWRVKAGDRHVGYFDTREEGREAYLAAIKERYGEFARAE